MWWLLAALSNDADAGKAEREARREVRMVRRHSQTLATFTDEYWRAVRWSDYTRAAQYLEDPIQRANWVIDQSESPELRIQTATVLTISIGPALEEGEHLREAQALVQIEGYTPKSQTLQKDTRVQLWVLTPNGWYIDPGQEFGESAGER